MPLGRGREVRRYQLIRVEVLFPFTLDATLDRNLSSFGSIHVTNLFRQQTDLYGSADRDTKKAQPISEHYIIIIDTLFT